MKSSRVKHSSDLNRKKFDSASSLVSQDELVDLYSVYDFYFQNLLIKNKEKKQKKSFIFNFYRTKIYILLMVQVILSVIDMVRYLIKTKKSRPSLATWTGDYYDKELKGDFRLSNYWNLVSSNSEYNHVLFIRSKGLSLTYLISNYFKRREFSLYVDPFIKLSSLFSKKKIVNQISYEITPTFIIDKLFKFYNVKVFVPWEYSSRQYLLLKSAKKSKIFSIGFMHGAGMKSYMVHEFIKTTKKINFGPDLFGVWSKYWLSYFNDNSDIYGNVEVSGYLRNNKSESQISYKDNKRKNFKLSSSDILIIAEPLSDFDECVEYYDFFVSNARSVTLKIRDSADDKNINLIRKRYHKEINFVSSKINDSIPYYDLIVGTHSTGVLDSLLFNKNLLLFDTKKWGNYFELDDEFFISDKEYDPMILESKIMSQNLPLLREKIFGSNKRCGVKWLVERINENIVN